MAIENTTQFAQSKIATDLMKHMDSAIDIIKHGDEEHFHMSKKPEKSRKNDTEKITKRKSNANSFLIMLFEEERLNDNLVKSLIAENQTHTDIMMIIISPLRSGGCAMNITKNIIKTIHNSIASGFYLNIFLIYKEFK